MTTAQVAEMLGVQVGHVPQRLSAAKRRGEWVSPARGLWVPVLPEFRARSGLPATEFVAALMHHLEVQCYVGWLAAASLYGAAHHAPQVTHVATSRHVRDRQIGRARLVFHERSAVAHLPVVERTARSGTFRVSSPALTALDVAADIGIAGGLDNAMLVIVELEEVAGLSDETLTALAPRFTAAAVRRVGWAVEHFTGQRLDALADHAAQGQVPPSRLHPAMPLTGALDHRWGLRLNVGVELD